MAPVETKKAGSSDADLLWKRGVQAYFDGQSAEASRLFFASLDQDVRRTGNLIAKRALFTANSLGANDGKTSDVVVSLLRFATAADPELRPAHSELCLELVGTSKEEVPLAAANAIVEGGFWSHPLQRPASFLPGLQSAPFWEATDFAWIRELERNFARIEGEVDRLLSSVGRGEAPSSWPQVGGEHRSSGRTDGDAVLAGDWREVVLFGSDEESSEHGRSLAPVAASLVTKIIPEAVTMASAGAGEVVLSALAPGTRVAPHCARANHRLTAHLAIRVPKESGHSNANRCECGVRVGAETRTWEEGKTMVFDDSYEHEVWNLTDRVRVVLLIRFWHPTLATEDQRANALERIEADMAFLQRIKLLPPLAPGYAEPGEALEAELAGRVGPVCPACGAEGAGGDLALDESRGRATLVSRCCGRTVE